MERKRLEEWETQRKNELVQHRQREQEKVLELKAKQEHLNTKLEEMVNSSIIGTLFFKEPAQIIEIFVFRSLSEREGEQVDD